MARAGSGLLAPDSTCLLSRPPPPRPCLLISGHYHLAMTPLECAASSLSAGVQEQGVRGQPAVPAIGRSRSPNWGPKAQGSGPRLRPALKDTGCPTPLVQARGQHRVSPQRLCPGSPISATPFPRPDSNRAVDHSPGASGGVWSPATGPGPCGHAHQAGPYGWDADGVGPAACRLLAGGPGVGEAWRLEFFPWPGLGCGAGLWGGPSAWLWPEPSDQHSAGGPQVDP